MARALQHTHWAPAAGALMRLRPSPSGLTARQAEVICADPTAVLHLGADPRPPAHLHGRPAQASGGLGRRAGSDHPDVAAAAPPARLGPVGMSPRRTPRVALDPTVPLPPADAVPPIVANALQEGGSSVVICVWSSRGILLNSAPGTPLSSHKARGPRKS
jgi:hypothetical protein